MESDRLGLGTVLVATDLRGSLTPAVRYAQALAARHGSKLVLADVVDPLRYGLECGEEELYGTEGGRPRELERMMNDMRMRGIVANATPRRRTICQRILELAKEHRANVIVVGTRGDDATSRMALGKVARELAGRAGASVIAVPGEAFVESLQMSLRVVAATDLTPASLAALRLAQSLFHGSLTLLHAGECRGGHDCLNRLERLRAEARNWRTTQVDHVVVRGEPGPAIAEYSRTQNADMVLLGSPAELALSAKSSSSTVAQVIAQVSCPVMCVRRVEEDFVERPYPTQRIGTHAAEHRHIA